MVTLREAKNEDFFSVLWFMKEYQRTKGYTEAEYEEAVARLIQYYPAYVWILENVNRYTPADPIGYVWATPWEEQVLFVQQMYAPKHGSECYHQLRKEAIKYGFKSIASIVTTEAQKKLFTQPKYGLKEIGTVLKDELKVK